MPAPQLTCQPIEIAFGLVHGSAALTEIVTAALVSHSLIAINSRSSARRVWRRQISALISEAAASRRGDRQGGS